MKFEGNGVAAPAVRAAIMGAMVRYLASLSQPATFSGMQTYLLSEFGLEEDDIGGDIYHAYCVLVLSGVILSNDYDAQQQVVTVGPGTTLWPNRLVTDFVWSEPKDKADS